MISKNTIKLINSLAYKKYRQKEQLFLVEGEKNVVEILHSDYKTELLIADATFLNLHEHELENVGQTFQTEKNEIKKISLLKSPQSCIALCKIPPPVPFPKKLDDNLILYLDGVQDPGNLGTITRICDWFGIRCLFCSRDTVDIYNPKVIQASMGSFCRINIWYSEFEPVAELAKSSKMSIVGAFLNGSDIYRDKLPGNKLLVIGNEGNGIRKEVENIIDTRLTIPRYSGNTSGAESLNAAVATGIICAELRRKDFVSGYSK